MDTCVTMCVTMCVTPKMGPKWVHFGPILGAEGSFRRAEGFFWKAEGFLCHQWWHTCPKSLIKHLFWTQNGSKSSGFYFGKKGQKWPFFGHFWPFFGGGSPLFQWPKCYAFWPLISVLNRPKCVAFWPLIFKISALRRRAEGFFSDFTHYKLFSPPLLPP